MPEFSYHRASDSELERIWEKDIAENRGDERWLIWREEYIAINKSGRGVTFVVCSDGEPIGQGTLLLSPECSAIGGRLNLADNISVGNINALRIDRGYRGDGHMSALLRRIEAHARSLRLSALTIGVEADKVRNISIYLHWGYTDYVGWETGDNIPVLYYRKELN